MKIKYKVISGLLIIAILLNVTSTTWASETVVMNTTTASAKVENINSSTYSVTIPSYISTGDLSPTEENKVGYSLFVDNYDINKGQVVVGASSSAKLIHNTESNNTISVTNNFDTKTVIEDTTVIGNLSIDPSEVRTAAEGDYTGKIIFDFEYQFFADDDVVQPDFQWEVASEGSTATNITGGMLDYIDNIELGADETINLIFNQITEGNTAVNPNLEDYFDADDLSGVNEGNASGVNAIAEYVSDKYLNVQLEYFYSINVVKTSIKSGDTSSELIEDTQGNVLELQVGYDSSILKDSQRIIVVREHEGVAESFTQLTSKPTEYVDGTFYVDEDYIYIYSSKYSVYSIGTADLKEGSTPDPDPTPDPDSTPDPDPTPDPDLAPDPDLEEGPLEDLPDGEYTAEVSMLQYYNTSLYSMCDVLFYENADLVVEGDEAILTLYVIDPIPNFASYGTPISDVWFEYEEEIYTAEVSTHNEEKYFEADGAFISNAGTYAVSKLTVTLPKDAVLDAYQPALVCSAYVDAVMMSRQQFYVILEIDGVSGDVELPEVEEEEEDDSTGDSSGDTTGGDSSEDDSSGNSSSGNSSSGSGSSGSSSSGSTTVTDLTDGSYTADVTMLQYYDTSQASMCDVLFYNTADILVSGDDATLTLYVIDPIPNFSSYGTPISDVWFEYNGTKYTATISSYSSTKYFDADGSFISESGNYSVSVLTVTLPKAAILEAYQPSLVCSPYVDAVMMSRQQFYVILEVDGVTDGSYSGAGSSGSSNTDDEVYIDGELNDISAEGTYIAAVDFKKEAEFESFSMCDTLFYSYSDIIVKDRTATVVLYIIDPIPGYESYGTPITEVSFEFDGVTYLAEVDTSDQTEKYFPADDRFIFTSDDYYTSRIIVTVPAEAIETSQNATLKCTGFVNAVMNSYQTFYVVFSELEWISDSTDGSLDVNTQEVEPENDGAILGEDEEQEVSTIRSVTIHGSSYFVWILLGIVLLSGIICTGYLIYRRRNR